MTINTKELQRFYDVFGPMITCLPTIINAIERDAELQLHVVILQAEALAATEERDKAKVDQGLIVTAANVKLQQIAIKSKDATLLAEVKIKAESDRVLTATTQANADIAAQVARVEVAQVAATADTIALGDQAKIREAEYSARSSDLEQQIKALDAKQVLAERSLAALRAKLG